jgi:hypothetical protein
MLVFVIVDVDGYQSVIEQCFSGSSLACWDDLSRRRALSGQGCPTGKPPIPVQSPPSIKIVTQNNKALFICK